MRTSQSVTDIAGQSMLATEWVVMAGALDSAAGPNRLPTLVAGGGVRGAVDTATLGARFDTSGAKTSGAARGGARLKVDITVVAPAGGVRTARGAVRTTNLATGAAAYLVFGAGSLVAACAARRAGDAERGLVNMAGKCMRRATGAATGGARARAGGADCPV